MSTKKTVRFKAFQRDGDSTFEITEQMLSATKDRQFGHMLRKFFGWFNTMKDYKVDTGFSGKKELFFAITVDGHEVVNTESLASRFKVVNKFKLNKSPRSKKRFTSLAWALFNLGVDWDKKPNRVSDEQSINALITVLTAEAEVELQEMKKRRLAKAGTVEVKA